MPVWLDHHECLGTGGKRRAARSQIMKGPENQGEEFRWEARKASEYAPEYPNHLRCQEVGLEHSVLMSGI